MSQGDFNEVEPDDLQLAIQAMDDEYFEANPEVDYNIRPAYPDELAMAGHPEYHGLMLVYVVKGGAARMRRPVSGIDDAMDFMVQYEKQSDE